MRVIKRKRKLLSSFEELANATGANSELGGRYYQIGDK